MSMGRRAPLKKWDEHDAVTGWRHVLCYIQRPGVWSKLKRQVRRRERRMARQQLTKEQ